MSLPPNAQWLRVVQVVVGKSGSGLLVENLKIDFEITKTLKGTPNHAIIKIYNLNPSNESLIQNEFDEIIVNAGYKGNLKVIFRGNIKHVFKYPEKNDRITEIEAADGDEDYRNSYLNTSLAAGATRSDIIDQAVGTFATTTKGHIGIDEDTHIRGVVLTGNTRHILDDLAQEAGANWSIQDGLLTIVKTSGVLPNQAIVINKDTGMLGPAEVNDKGISVKCLMNPDLAVNGAVKLDNNNIHIREQKFKALGKAQKVKAPIRLSPDGIYKIVKLDHKGTNINGNDWYTELQCLGLGQTIPDNSDEDGGDTLGE